MTKTFRDLGVDDDLAGALETQGISSPFPIQELALPLALEGHDLIGQARTGTGKTLAFGLPLLQRIDPSHRRTQALVVVPTRELCVQVHYDLTIGEQRGITSVSVYGGVPYEEQIEALTTGAHVVVGTPGRLIDHLNRGNLDLTDVRVLVLDEADEMLDMGFLPDVERLISTCPEQRHTMLFSATMPTAIVKLARRYLQHPTFTRADTEAHEVAPTVDQHFFSVHRMDKPRVLARILQSPNRGGCYVFVRTKHMADRLVTELEDLGVPAIAIHGDLRQQTRERNLDRFRSGKADVLVATEVAARGLDVTGVTHVINYDCPDDEKMYLHRIGRTARAGEAGVAITFAEFNETDRLNVIRKAVGAHDNEVVQVFSTSDVLTERFDLPEERPWDHLAKSPQRPSGRAEEDRTSKRGGRSDGRPKSPRHSEGRGAGHDATRSRGRDTDRAPRRRSGDSDRTEGGGAGGAATTERTRTRTRTRTGGGSGTSGATENGTRSGSGGRARASEPTRSRRSGRSEGRSSRGSRSKADPGDRGGSKTPSRSNTRSSEGGASKTGPTDRGGSRGGNGEAGEREDGGRRRGSRPRGRSEPRDRSEPGGHGEPPGRAARGQGQPQLARRVKVEHLP